MSDQFKLLSTRFSPHSELTLDTEKNIIVITCNTVYNFGCCKTF